jgi:hypothetical protein
VNSAPQLTGTIPAALGAQGNLTQTLRMMWLNNNALSGSIPADLGALHNCTFIDVSYNQARPLLPQLLRLPPPPSPSS